MFTTVFSRLIILVLLFSIVPMNASNAQDPIILTISLPTYADEIPPNTFADFEAQFNVRVVIKDNPLDVYIDSSATNLDSHLEDLQRYAESADVLFVNNWTLSPIGLQTNFLLDIGPLAYADPALDAASFVPAVWEAFQWNSGLWALPAGFDTVVLGYNQAAFDAAGLAYPHAGWTIDDYANTARMLTVYDSNGNVITPGFEEDANDIHFLMALAGIDDPALPALNQPSLVNAIQLWADLKAEGVVGLSSSSIAGDVQTMRLFNSYEFTQNPNAGAALLPGERAFLNANGFAISSGTQYPELAYELAKVAIANPRVLQITFSTYSAQPGLVPAPHFAQPELRQAPTNARSTLNFADYLSLAITDVMQGHPPDIALDNAQIRATQDLHTAQEVGNTTTLVVMPPPTINTDGLVLNFSVATSIWPLPNQAQWDSAAQAFADSDAEVSAVVVEAPFTSLDEQSQNYDCFYSSERALLQIDTAILRPLDPLMNEDPNFIPDDFVGDTLQFLQVDNQTWGYPITIMPRFLKYQAGVFNRAGIPSPAWTWTVNEFEDALNNISGQPAFARADSVSIMALIAAYGGQPLDYETDPPTPRFNDPANIAAIEQVLNLARNGHLDYQALSVVQGMGQSPATAVISPIIISQFGDLWQMNEEDALVNYPAGSQHIVAAFGLGVGYVYASTPYPEACYRWLAFVSSQPDLFTSMPARLSVLHQEQTRFLVGDVRMDMYQQYADVLQQPNLIIIPFVPLVGTGNRTVLQFWLNRAFDHYVLEGADLASALAEAQEYADAYLRCRAENRSAFDCATTIDPATQAIIR